LQVSEDGGRCHNSVGHWNQVLVTPKPDKPTEAIRSYGQIVGHVADAQYTFCSLALGENNPGLKIEQTKTTKADLVAALKDAVAYCDKAYDGMTDASGAQKVSCSAWTCPNSAC
jgi:hypothetical protein